MNPELSQPLVSIVLPTYNRAGLIGETIQSVIGQTYTHWELIVVDDGSEDDTESVVTGFAHNQIRYTRISHTGRLGAVRNCGIKLAKGDYIAFVDSDDLWRPDKLAFQLSLSRQYPQASFVFSNGNQFGDGAIIPPDWDTLFVGKFFKAMVFENKFCIYTSSFVFKKKVFEKIGPIKEHLVIDCDVDFFFRATYLFEGIFTNERLINIRKHSHNTSSNVSFLPYTELIEIYRSFYAEGWLTKTQHNMLAGAMYYKMARDLYKQRKRKSAFASFLKYNSLMPMNWKGWIRLLQTSPFALSSDD